MNMLCVLEQVEEITNWIRREMEGTRSCLIRVMSACCLLLML
jgi:hypothetical protein